MAMRFIVVTSLIILASSCMDRIDDRNLSVLNKSELTIFSIISPNDEIGTSSFYAAYSNARNKNDENSVLKFNFDPIEPNQEVENHDRPRDWNSYLNEIPDHKIRVYIVAQDSVKKYGWQSIFKNQIFIKKYKLSEKELENINWKIQFK